jgi:acyl carrier protein
MALIRDRLSQTILKAIRSPLAPSALENMNLVRDLGISSIDALEILIGIEIEFGIEIPDEDLRSDLLVSLDLLEDYLRPRMPANV